MRLMIEGNADYLARVLAAIAKLDGAQAPAPAAIPPMPATGGEGDDDDEDGAPAPFEPVPGAPVEVDSNGIPWDERLHSGKRTQNQDGSWRYRKGMNAAAAAPIEAELRAAMSQPATPPMPAIPAPATPPAPLPAVPPIPAPTPAPVTPPIPAPAPVAALPPMPIEAPAPVPTPAPAPAPIPAPAPAGTLDFGGFMQHIALKMQEKNAAGQPLITMEYLAGLTAEVSTAWAAHLPAPLTAITDLNNVNPQIIEYTVALLTRDGKW